MAVDWKHIATEQMAEIERQRVLVDKHQMELDALLAWANNDGDALFHLQAIYRNPTTSEAHRIRAASAALDFEKPKPPRLNVVVDWSEQLREARLTRGRARGIQTNTITIEREQDGHRWTTQEHQPLDLNAPTKPTILGNPDGPEADRPAEPDPAA
jgi:hypothetical protein